MATIQNIVTRSKQDINSRKEKQLFVTTSVLANGATYDSTVLGYDGYTQVQTEVLASHDGSLQIDFSSDSVGTDIIRTLTIPYVATEGYQLFGSVCFGSYVRYQFTNNSGSLQTDFYLTTKVTTTSLNPQMLRADGFVSSSMLATLNRSILTGEDNDGVYRSVHVTKGGVLENSITDANLGFHAIVTAGGGLKTNESTHLVGEPFGGSALNTIEWAISLTGSGTQDGTGSGELSIDTGTTADSAVEINSSDRARFIPANYNTSHHAITIPDGASYAANNSRKWGAIDLTDATPNGVYFEIDGGTWYIAQCLNGTPTRVTRASWNGVGASTFPDASITANVYEIEYNAGSIIYRVNGQVMHRSNLLATPYANDIHFPVGMSNTNSGGSTTDVSLKIRAAAIYTLGKGKGQEKGYYISGTTAGIIIKTGAGHLGKIIFARNGAGGGDATISIYDSLSATNQIGRIAIDQDITVPVQYDISFNTGLYVVITGAGTLGTTITFD